MKLLGTITDPQYQPKAHLTAYEKFWLRFINDERDLPFVHLLTRIHLIVFPGLSFCLPRCCKVFIGGWRSSHMHMWPSLTLKVGLDSCFIVCVTARCSRKGICGCISTPPGSSLLFSVIHRKPISLIISSCTMLKTIRKMMRAAP